MENNIIKDLRNLFRLKEIDHTKIKNVRNRFRLKKNIYETAIKYIRNLLDWKKKMNNQRQNN